MRFSLEPVIAGVGKGYRVARDAVNRGVASYQRAAAPEPPIASNMFQKRPFGGPSANFRASGTKISTILSQIGANI